MNYKGHTVKEIHTVTHADVARIRSLHHKKGRLEHKQIMIEGLRACQTFIDHASPSLIALYVTETFLTQSNPLPIKNYTVVLDHVMEKISASTTPSGILGIFELPQPPTPELLSPGIVLAHLQDPGNMGTLIRTAAALKMQSVVVIEGADVWSPKVIQASAGTCAMLKIFQWSWDELLQYKKNIPLCALVIQGGTHPSHTTLAQSLLVIGNEAQGLPEAWRSACDTAVTLPMPGGTESLNAAVAGSIALYISYLQRNHS